VLKNGHIISFGENHMVVGIVYGKGDKEGIGSSNNSPENQGSKLMIQFIDGPKAKEIL